MNEIGKTAQRKQQGFTLLELLVVLVIIGLLAGIVGPRLFANVDKSKVTTAKAQISVLSKAVEQLRLDIGRYPSAQEGLALLSSPPADYPRLEWTLFDQGCATGSLGHAVPLRLSREAQSGLRH
jgi:type II secretion system protein G